MKAEGQRVIGMLGGMSWESSAQYYRLANELVRERLGGLHSARCLLASVDFADIETLQTAGKWEEAGQLLAEAAMGLEAGDIAQFGWAAEAKVPLEIYARNPINQRARAFAISRNIGKLRVQSATIARSSTHFPAASSSSSSI